MIDFNKIIDYCKDLSKAILHGGDNANINSSNILSEEDERDIMNSMNDSSFWADREAKLKQINVNDEWKKLEKKINIPKVKKLYYWYYAAAILIIGLGIGVFYNTPIFNQAESSQIENLEQQIVAGSDKAILSTESGDEIELAEETVYTTDDASLKNNQLLYDKKTTSDELRYHYLTIPRGCKFFVELSDGTKVWLNSESKLKFPVQFVPGQSREVELVYGEAYFDVSHSTEHGGDSFVVKQKKQQIEVLGTEFNLRAYQGEEIVYTTLVKGRVKIINPYSSEILRPGQQAVNNRLGAVMLNNVDVLYATAWKDGFFMFHNAQLQDMMRQLSRWYDADVEFVDEDKKTFSFSGTLKREDDITKLLNRLEKTGEVQFEIKNKKIMIR